MKQVTKKLPVSFVATCSILPFVLLANIAIAQQPQVIQLEETIRGNQEQPKVLTIVPWQSPKTKQALPSAIVERINKKFVPLQRDELKRQIKVLDKRFKSINTYPNP